MTCESWQEQTSGLLDAELEESDQVRVFRHLETCQDCRLFLDSMIRFRKAVQTDQERILLTADEVVPARLRIPPSRSAREPGWMRALLGWRLPAPVAVGMAAVLVAGGVLLGARLESAAESAGKRGEPQVVLVYGLPQVEVVGNAGSPR